MCCGSWGEEHVSTTSLNTTQNRSLPIATFLKILTQKGFVEHKKGTGKLLIYSPLITKEKYRRRVMEEVKDDFFGNSFKSMFSFFVKEEHLTAEDIEEILNQIKEEENI